MGGVHLVERAALRPAGCYRDPSLCLHPCRPGSGRACPSWAPARGPRWVAERPRPVSAAPRGNHPPLGSVTDLGQRTFLVATSTEASGLLGDHLDTPFRRPWSRLTPLRVSHLRNVEAIQGVTGRSSRPHFPYLGSDDGRREGERIRRGVTSWRATTSTSTRRGKDRAVAGWNFVRGKIRRGGFVSTARSQSPRSSWKVYFQPFARRPACCASTRASGHRHRPSQHGAHHRGWLPHLQVRAPCALADEP
jgi:hypothetical protein